MNATVLTSRQLENNLADDSIRQTINRMIDGL